MATVGETLFIALGVDTSSAVEGLKQLQNNLQNISSTAGNSAQKLENDTQKALQNVDNSAKSINNTLLKAEEQTKNAGSSFETMTSKWGGALKGLFTSILAPIAGAMTAGAVLKGYFSDVAQVAQMTGAYSSKMEEWRKKRNMLARVNKEDVELYKKIREGMFKFNEAMANVSTTIMRSISPAIKFLVGLLDKFSNWLNANQNNIVRFIKILAVTISVALIPSLIKMGKALLMNPLTWIIATLGVLVLIIDDLVTYIHGGDSALGGLWSQFGTGEEIGKALNSVLQNLMAILSVIGKPLAVLASGFGAFKIVQTLIGGVVKGIYALRTALTVLTAHPIVAFLTLIIGLIMWITDAFNRAGGDWSKVFDIMAQDVVDFLNLFGGLGDQLKAYISSLFGFISDIFNSIKDYFINVYKILTDSNLSFFEKVKGIFNAFIELVGNVAKAIIDRFKESFAAVVDIFSKIFEPINNALKGALSNIWNNIKNTFTMIKDYIISVFKEAFDFLGNGISKVKNSLGSAVDKVKSFIGVGSNDAKDLTEVATASNVANNNYKNDVNKSVVQNINVDARGSEKQAGEFVASLTQDTNDYNSYSNNSQTAQF